MDWKGKIINIAFRRINRSSLLTVKPLLPIPILQHLLYRSGHLDRKIGGELANVVGLDDVFGAVWEVTGGEFSAGGGATRGRLGSQNLQLVADSRRLSIFVSVSSTVAVVKSLFGSA